MQFLQTAFSYSFKLCSNMLKHFIGFPIRTLKGILNFEVNIHCREYENEYA